MLSLEIFSKVAKVVPKNSALINEVKKNVRTIAFKNVPTDVLKNVLQMS